MIRLILSILLFIGASSIAGAQVGTPKTVADLQAEVISLWPDNTTGQITPLAARQTLLDIIASYGNLSTASVFTSPPSVPTASFGTNTLQAASTAFVLANGGGTFLNTLPPFTTVCNPTGITGAAQACAAVTASSPLVISGNVLSITNMITASTATFLGVGAGNLTLSGVNNTGVGVGSIPLLTSGAQNVAVGAGSGSHFTSSSNNVALGYAALSTLSTGGTNIAIGTQSLQTLDAHFENVAIGYNSLKDLLSGDGNTCVGYQCGGGVTTGSLNTFIGGLNCICTPGITTGSNNVVLGGVTGLSGSLSGAIIFGDGAGNIRLSWDNTASRWTAAGGIIAPAMTGNGTPPTGNTGTCSTGVTVVGGSSIGTWTSTAICALAGTIILTAMPTQPTGYVCRMSDRTTAGVVIEETATTVTSATFVVRSLPTGTVATVANDILQYDCKGY